MHGLEKVQLYAVPSFVNKKVTQVTGSRRGKKYKTFLARKTKVYMHSNPTVDLSYEQKGGGECIVSVIPGS